MAPRCATGARGSRCAFSGTSRGGCVLNQLFGNTASGVPCASACEKSITDTPAARTALCSAANSARERAPLESRQRSPSHPRAPLPAVRARRPSGRASHPGTLRPLPLPPCFIPLAARARALHGALAQARERLVPVASLRRRHTARRSLHEGVVDRRLGVRCKCGGRNHQHAVGGLLNARAPALRQPHSGGRHVRGHQHQVRALVLRQPRTQVDAMVR